MAWQEDLPAEAAQEVAPVTEDRRATEEVALLGAQGASGELTAPMEMPVSPARPAAPQPWTSLQSPDYWYDARRTRLEQFFHCRVMSSDVNPLASDQGVILHDALMRGISHIASEDIHCRRASICLDETPVVYSLKLAREAHFDKFPDFRMLVEPGGLGITVPQQVDNALRIVDELLQRLEWQAAAEDINAVVTRVFPRDSASLSHWWGGIWLGMALTHDRAELRIYLNLRHGEALQRWQRVADVLTWFGDDSLTLPLESLIARACPHAIPVGLGVVISKSLCGFRIYTGMYNPSLQAIGAAGAVDTTELCDANSDISVFYKAFTTAFGPLARQSVTMGYDFVLRDGLLVPNVTRTKADICCQFVARDHAGLLESLLEDRLRESDSDAAPLRWFLRDLQSSFGGATTEFIGMGLGERAEPINIYVRPHGCAHA
jgi:hypothetical protein